MIGISLDIPEVAVRGGAGWSPPLLSGVAPDIFADFVSGHYSTGATKYASATAWLTGISGTYTRASSATYISNGVVQTATSGVMRFPGNNGLRLTGSGTNLHLHSAISDSVGSYSASNATLTANASTDPSGGSAAASFVPTVATNIKGLLLSAGLNLTSATVYTFSAFIKPFGANTYAVALDPFNTLVNYATFNLANGTVNSTVGAGTTSSITAIANGWFLISVSAAAPSTANFNAVVESWSIGGANRNITGDGSSGWFVWGMQVTASSFALDYIPTTTATVTQATDLFTFPFAQTAFTVLAGTNGVNVINGGPVNATIFADNATGNTYLYANGVSVSANPLFATYNNTDWVLGPATSGTFLTSHKSAAAGNNSGRAITSDGLTPNSDAHTFVSAAAANAALGSILGGAQSLNGNLSMFAVWNGLVASNANLQALTT